MKIFTRAAIVAGMLGLAVLMGVGPLGLAQSASAAGAPLAVNQCNSVFNDGGRGMNCQVEVTNYLNLASNVQYSVTTTVACDGAANTVPLPRCTTTVIPSTELVTSATQCDGADNGGGASLICDVHILNQLYDPNSTSTTTAATVNQCDATSGTTGTAPMVVCNPSGSTTTGATVTQCNGSGNGGGTSLIVQCTVDPLSMITTALPVTVDQCNGSSNGGGGTVLCHTFIENQLLTLADVNDTPVLPAASSVTAGASNFVPAVIGSASGAGGSSTSGAAPAVLAATGGGFGPTPVLAVIALLLGGSLGMIAWRSRILHRDK